MSTFYVIISIDQSMICYCFSSQVVVTSTGEVTSARARARVRVYVCVCACVFDGEVKQTNFTMWVGSVAI